MCIPERFDSIQINAGYFKEEFLFKRQSPLCCSSKLSQRGRWNIHVHMNMLTVKPSNKGGNNRSYRIKVIVPNKYMFCQNSCNILAMLICSFSDICDRNAIFLNGFSPFKYMLNMLKRSSFIKRQSPLYCSLKLSWIGRWNFHVHNFTNWWVKYLCSREHAIVTRVAIIGHAESKSLSQISTFC